MDFFPVLVQTWESRSNSTRFLWSLSSSQVRANSKNLWKSVCFILSSDNLRRPATLGLYLLSHENPSESWISCLPHGPSAALPLSRMGGTWEDLSAATHVRRGWGCIYCFRFCLFVCFCFYKLRHLWALQLSLASRRVMVVFFYDFYPRRDFSPLTALKH